MSSPIVAKRYAQALLDVCDSAEVQTRAGTELHAFIHVLKSPEIESFLMSPVISIAEKKSALEAIKDQFPTTLRFFTTLVEAGRMQNVREMVQTYDQLREAASGEMSAEIISAHPLSKETLEEIQQTLEEKWKKKLRLKAHVNSDLIGGFMVKAPGKIFDATVASQIDNLSQQIATR